MESVKEDNKWNEISKDTNTPFNITNHMEEQTTHPLSDYNNYLFNFATAPVEETDYDQESYEQSDIDTTSESSTSTIELVETWQRLEFSEHDKSVLQTLGEKYNLDLEDMKEDSWIDLTDEFNVYAEFPRTTAQLKIDWDIFQVSNPDEIAVLNKYKKDIPLSNEVNESVQQLPSQSKWLEETYNYPIIPEDKENLAHVRIIDHSQQGNEYNTAAAIDQEPDDCNEILDYSLEKKTAIVQNLNKCNEISNEKEENTVIDQESDDDYEILDYSMKTLNECSDRIHLAEQNTNCERENDERLENYYEPPIVEQNGYNERENSPVQYIMGRENYFEPPNNRPLFRKYGKGKRLKKKHFSSKNSTSGRSKFVEYAYEKLKYLEEGLKSQYGTDDNEIDMVDNINSRRRHDIEEARKEAVRQECEVLQENLKIKKLMIKKLLSEIKSLNRQQ